VHADLGGVERGHVERAAQLEVDVRDRGVGLEGAEDVGGPRDLARVPGPPVGGRPPPPGMSAGGRGGSRPAGLRVTGWGKKCSIGGPAAADPRARPVHPVRSRIRVSRKASRPTRELAQLALRKILRE
jgi:hypothetical protein